ncbi:hypothetical protein [Pedobacter sp. L105]|uniref:hypothetical protein n=1 Tax=Pedobacter sp. L105 TaxID=1641871 RepID=UPI00131BB798|nr:hypothetical protein [Pedobacter sp. L105]
MKNLESEILEVEEKKILTRDQLRQIFSYRDIVISDGGTSGTCHYTCVYDDSSGNTHTFTYTGTSCSSNSDCTNSAPCAALGDGRDWVVSQTCS